MKGIIGKIRTAGWLAAGLLAAEGCATYDQVVDRCYPDRYDQMARREVHQALDAQVHNGHVLDQTVWNTEFEPGTDRLTAGGMAHLATLARRRPAPDPTIFLQVAEDVSYDPAAPDRFVQARNQLDNQRGIAIQRYLNAETDGRGVPFNVVVHDPPVPDTTAISQGLAVQKMSTTAEGALKQLGGKGS